MLERRRLATIWLDKMPAWFHHEQGPSAPAIDRPRCSLQELRHVAFSLIGGHLNVCLCEICRQVPDEVQHVHRHGLVSGHTKAAPEGSAPSLSRMASVVNGSGTTSTVLTLLQRIANDSHTPRWQTACSFGNGCDRYCLYSP